VDEHHETKTCDSPARHTCSVTISPSFPTQEKGCQHNGLQSASRRPIASCLLSVSWPGNKHIYCNTDRGTELLQLRRSKSNRRILVHQSHMLSNLRRRHAVTIITFICAITSLIVRVHRVIRPFYNAMPKCHDARILAPRSDAGVRYIQQR
jgi:hypothetical protein